MKQLEKISGININDFYIIGPALTEASTRIVKDYKEGTHPKLKMLDSLIVLSLATFVLQIVYA